MSEFEHPASKLYEMRSVMSREAPDVSEAQLPSEIPADF